MVIATKTVNIGVDEARSVFLEFLSVLGADVAKVVLGHNASFLNGRGRASEEAQRVVLCA